MSTAISELIAQKDALERKIREAQAAGKAQAIAEIRSLMAEHGLSAADLASPARASSKTGALAGQKVKPKYRDPVSGATWTGRGLKPKWLVAAIDSGSSLDQFAI